MYCPRCGQQPAFESLRFCPTCGLRLDGVMELLASNGAPATLGPPAPTAVDPASPKRRGMRQGAKLMLLSGVALPLFLAFCASIRHGGPMLIPVTLFLAGLAWLSYYKLFGADYSSPIERMTIRPPAPVNVLRQPESYATPVTERPQSVTEPTTRFFN